MLSDFSEIYQVLEEYKVELASSVLGCALEHPVQPEKASSSGSRSAARSRRPAKEDIEEIGSSIQILKNQTRADRTKPSTVRLSIGHLPAFKPDTKALELTATTTAAAATATALFQSLSKQRPLTTGKRRASSLTLSQSASKETDPILRRSCPLKTWLSCLVLSLKSESLGPFVSEDVLQRHLASLQCRLRGAQKLLLAEAEATARGSSSNSDEEEKAYQALFKAARLSLKQDSFDIACLLKSSIVFPGPCYAFIDHSNMLHGAHDYMSDWIDKKILSRGDIGLDYRVLLRTIQRCGRPILKTFIAGSDPGANACDEVADLRGCLKTDRLSGLAGTCDPGQHLEILMLRRVFRSGAYREQCVDEILHNRILETLLEAEASPRYAGQQKSPGTLVLVTGDGSQGEFGRGFFSYVLKALSRQWHVECHSWTPQLSGNYLKLTSHPRFKFVPLESIATDMLCIQSI